MSSPARVHSIEAVKAFREALCGFGVDAQAALCAADQELRRFTDWVQSRLQFWQQQVREQQEEVTRAKTALIQRRWGHRDGKGPGSTEAEIALRKAQQRLQEAEAKVGTVRRWLQQLPHALLEYEGPARQLSGFLESDLRQGLAILGRKLDALEAYASLRPSAGPGPGETPAERGDSAEPTEEEGTPS